MNDVLTYTAFALLVFIFRITVVIDKDTFSDVDISKVDEKLVRYFIRIRRWRIAIGILLLAYCGGYVILSVILPPVMNLFFEMFMPEMHFLGITPSNVELAVVICISLILILAYYMEAYIDKLLSKKYQD